MRTPVFLTGLSSVIMLGLLAGCSQTGSTTSASAPSTMTDSDLQRAIQSSLEADAQLSAAKIDIDADAKDNKITLKGTVPTETMRIRAVELAKAGRPNLEVTDKIDVKPGNIDRKDYTEDMARETLRRQAFKIPLRTRMIKRGIEG